MPLVPGVHLIRALEREVRALVLEVALPGRRRGAQHVEIVLPVADGPIEPQLVADDAPSEVA
jgi:hypothetical protein